jgi:hypothetical protein
MHCHGKIILGSFSLDVVDFFYPRENDSGKMTPGKMTRKNDSERLGLGPNLKKDIRWQILSPNSIA